ncbi:MAG: DUF4115 domain-containing protein [Chlorobium sp.]|nr:DUF4115 domain-containing protein [Chlorobium sp.]
MTFGSAGALLVRKLTQARKERGLSLEEVSAETRIQKNHLEKIEAGDLTFLPSAYVYAFLKEYAQVIGVDDPQLIESCRDELSIPTDLKSRKETQSPEEDSSQKGERFSGIFGAASSAGAGISPVVLVGGAVFLVIVLLAVGFFMFSAVHENPQTNSRQNQETEVLPAIPEPTIVEPDSVALADSSQEGSGESAPELAVKQEAWAKDVSFLPESPDSPYQQVLIVHITQDLSWVKIIADDGDRVYPGASFKAGEVLRYEAKRKLWVNIGRPPFVDLYLNGEKLPPMSKRTIVLGEE